MTREGAGCREVPGATGMQLPRVRASWQRLQHAQSMPEGARSFPRQRNAGLCPDPLGPRLQPAQQGPKDDFGTKGSHFFFFQSSGQALGAELAFSSVSAWDPPPHC